MLKLFSAFLNGSWRFMKKLLILSLLLSPTIQAGSSSGSSAGMQSGVQAESNYGLKNVIEKQNITISIGKSNGFNGTTGKSVVVMEAAGGGIFLGSIDPKDLKSGAIKFVIDQDPRRNGYVVLKQVEPAPEKQLASFEAAYDGKKKVISIGMSNGLDNATTGKIVIVEESAGGGRLLSVLNPNINTKINIGKTNGIFGTLDKIVVNQETTNGGSLLAVYPDENLSKELVESMSRLPFIEAENNKENQINTTGRNFKKDPATPILNNKKSQSSSASQQ